MQPLLSNHFDALLFRVDHPLSFSKLLRDTSPQKIALNPHGNNDRLLVFSAPQIQHNIDSTQVLYYVEGAISDGKAFLYLLAEHRQTSRLERQRTRSGN